jgi:putative exosortase-associated protein (TIGR04073 family)
MTKFKRFLGSFLFTSLLTVYTPISQADMQQQGYGDIPYTPVTQAYEPQQQISYGEIVGNKALNGFANLGTAWLEIPKNIINTTNQSNFFYGVFGGFLKGLVNTLGRTGAGIADILTIPIPTKPIAYPVYVWDDFDIDTSYGEVFRLYKTQQPASQAIAQTPSGQIAKPAVVIASPPKPVDVDRSDLYKQDTNSKLDTLFKKEMQK